MEARDPSQYTRVKGNQPGQFFPQMRKGETGNLEVGKAHESKQLMSKEFDGRQQDFRWLCDGDGNAQKIDEQKSGPLLSDLG